MWEMTRCIRLRLWLLQFSSKLFFSKSWYQPSFSKIVCNFFGYEHNCHRGRWKWSSIFWTTSLKKSAPKSYEQMKKEPDLEDLSQRKKIRKVWWKLVDVFLNSANFWQQALVLAPPSSYTMNLKTLTKVSQLLYEILGDAFLLKYC